MRSLRRIATAGVILALFAAAPAHADRPISVTAGPLLNAEEKVYAPDGQTVTCSTTSVVVAFIVELEFGDGVFQSISPCGAKSFYFPSACRLRTDEGFSCATEDSEGSFIAVDTLSFHPLRVLDGIVRDSRNRRRWDLLGTGAGVDPSA